MDLLIKYENHQIIFNLKEKKKVKGTFVFKENTALAQDFLFCLDKFLKKCNTNIVGVETIRLQEGKDVGLTSSRIVKTIVKTLQFVKK